VGLFRRRRPLHRQLADAAGIGLESGVAESLAADPPGWDGEQRGEPGIHGIPRARRWDVVGSAQAPDLRGDLVRFVSLPDRTLLVEEDQPDGSLDPLAAAVESSLEPPYRAEAVRRDGALWAVGASRIEVVEIAGLAGDQAELVLGPEGPVLRIDGRTTLQRSPALERVGEAEGSERVVRAERLDGDLWEVSVSRL